jgi:predicted ester cyclase
MANPEDITVEDKANQWDRITAGDDPTEIANKAIIARYVYATNIMDLDSFDGYVAEDYVEEEPIPGQKPGREGLKEAYKIFAGPFSDAVFVFVDLFAEGDLVFGRGEISGTNDGEFFGIPPTNKKISA